MKPSDFTPSKSNGFIGIQKLTEWAQQGVLGQYVFELKGDGSRYHLHLSRQHGAHLLSRRESVVTGKAVDKIDRVPHLRDLKLPKGWSYVVLDGEVMAPAGNHSALTEIIGSAPEKAVRLQEQHGRLTFDAFDVLYAELGDRRMEATDLRPYSFDLRRKCLVEAVLPGLIEANSGSVFYLKAFEQLRPPATHRVDAQVDWMRRQWQFSLNHGFEGLMVKHLEAAYGQGMFKWKIHRDTVVIVTGYEEGKGKYAGQIGAICGSVYHDGALTEVTQCSGMDDDVRLEVSKNRKKFLGRMMEIRGQEIDSNDSRVRHPRFRRWRDDITTTSCTWDQFYVDMTSKGMV